MKQLALMLTLFISIMTNQLRAGCHIFNSDLTTTSTKADALYLLLTQNGPCPQKVQELKLLIHQNHLNTAPYMVANRGRNNPTLGSFSFFESVTGKMKDTQLEVSPGDFFFGHFTRAHAGQVILDQELVQGKLMIELIAWDPQKNLFNFYELIGTVNKATWFYRGDTLDILDDNKFVHRNNPPGSSKFGNKLRCSACHSTGGPIMKELAFPHNDWWLAERPLQFGKLKLSSEIADYVTNVIDASVMAKDVALGLNKLERSTTVQKVKQSLSMQEQLRPLFCENEINLESELTPIENFKDDGTEQQMTIPSGFFISPLLGHVEVQFSINAYNELLEEFHMIFPETENRDADHPWLTPVKGQSDLLALKSLMNNQVVDKEFVDDVLSIDFTHPLFSKKRCELLKFIPNQPDWKKVFIKNLKNSSSAEAQELLSNLTDPTQTGQVHRERVTQYLMSLKDNDSAHFFQLLDLRNTVFSSEISKNPRGQILEPGFRVIFPEPQSH